MNVLVSACLLGLSCRYDGQSKGHPLAGDTLYGREEPELIARQALHAAYLTFPHPVTGAEVALEAALPDDIQKLLEKLRTAE